MPSRKGSEAQATQSERFIKAARELGCDESEEAFDAALRKVAKHRPKPLNKESGPPLKGAKKLGQ